MLIICFCGTQTVSVLCIVMEGDIQMLISSDKRKNGLELGLVLGTALVGFALYQMIHQSPHAKSLIIAAFCILLLALITPKLLHPLYVLWMKFALLLSLIITPFVMGIIFFGILTPVNFVLYLMGKDLLLIRPANRNKTTLWRQKDKTIPFDMKKQF